LIDFAALRVAVARWLKARTGLDAVLSKQGGPRLTTSHLVFSFRGPRVLGSSAAERTAMTLPGGISGVFQWEGFLNPPTLIPAGTTIRNVTRGVDWVTLADAYIGGDPPSTEAEPADGAYHEAKTWDEWVCDAFPTPDGCSFGCSSITAEPIPAGEELSHTSIGQRALTLSVQAYCTGDGENALEATSVLAAVQTALEDEPRGVLDALRAVGLVVEDVGEVLDVSEIAGAGWESRASLDVVIRTTDETVRKTGYIERMELEPTLTK